MIGPHVVLVFGDSIALGTGDAQDVGWPGRVCPDRRVTSRVIYNLGVASDTAEGIASRWRGEAAARTGGAGRTTFVFAFGLNDATLEEGRHRVPLERCLKVSEALMEEAAVQGSLRWIGPTPIDDGSQPRRVSTGELREKRNAEIARYDAAFAILAERLRVPYLRLFPKLEKDPSWTANLADGVHPDDAGHDRLAGLIGSWPPFRETLAG